MDVFEITHQTRPESVEVYSKAARQQVVRLIAALAHREADQDDISLARVSEAQAGLQQVMGLDEELRKFASEVDKADKMVQDRFYSLRDSLRDLTPNGRNYRVTQPKGSTNVQPKGQAKLSGSAPSTSISAAGTAKTSEPVRETGTGAGHTVERLT